MSVRGRQRWYKVVHAGGRLSAVAHAFSDWSDGTWAKISRCGAARVGCDERSRLQPANTDLCLACLHMAEADERRLRAEFAVRDENLRRARQ